MRDGERRDRGAAVYAHLLDTQPADVPAALAARVGDAFADEVLIAAGGPGWTDPSLSDRERDVATLAALVAQGVVGDRLTSHLVAARQHGLDDRGLTALMVLLAQYCGYPHASRAMEAVVQTG